MRRLGLSLAIASLALLCLLVGCSLITGLGDRPSYAIDGGGPDATMDADAKVGDAPPADVTDAAEAEACVDDAPCTGFCGVRMNKCGVPVACGGCPPGQSCGASGTANVCGSGTPCAPLCSLGMAQKSCGASDGCAGICTFGPCDAPGLMCVGGLCKCAPASCSGCCGAQDGQCHSGVGGPGGCGSGGVTCAPSTSLVCTTTGSYGQPCEPGSPAGGCQSPLVCGDAGTCGCTPNCAGAGCGDPDGCGGICQGENNLCPRAGERCVNGGLCTCDPSTCFGCCNGSICEASDAGLCGSFGVACEKCAPGTCNSGCGKTCGGGGQSCCDDGGCIAPLACSDGGTCTACSGSCSGKACGEGDGCGNTCTDGGCAPGLNQRCATIGGLTQCVCDSTSCPEGCCIGGACINGNDGNPALCGIDGGQCIACAAGQECSGGSCVTPPPADK